MPVGPGHVSSLSSPAVQAAYSAGLAALLLVVGCNNLQNAVAEGDTRTLSFHHTHTGEDLTVTYKVNGRYDEEALKQINHELRDWRKDETIAIDPHLIDLVWEVRRELGSNEPIWIVCGYRSAATNAMLRRRSSGVAQFSQHMLGKAMDFYIPGVPLEKLRETGLRAQRGGVGFYPSSNFVHLDTGSVRHWPHMPEAQLAAAIAKGPLSSARAGDPGSADSRVTKVASAARRPNPHSKRLGDEEDEDRQGASASSVAKAARSARSESPRVPSAESKAAAVVPVPPVRPGSKVAAKPDSGVSGFSLASAASMPVEISPSLRQGSPVATDLVGTRGLREGTRQIEDAQASAADRPSSEPPRPPAEIPAPALDLSASASLAPWPTPLRQPDETLLSYAPVNAAVSSARIDPMGVSAMREPPQPATTVAIKHTGNRPTTIVSAPPAPAPGPGPAKPSQRLNDPWVRAMIVSPSADSFMSTSQLGAPDYRTLSPYLRKPAMSVMMTFGDDPYLGMSTDKFAGTPVVFMSTVTFYQRTASLR